MTDRNIIAAIENTISISQFNRGLAGKIYADVRQSGAIVYKTVKIDDIMLIIVIGLCADDEVCAIAKKHIQEHEF